MRNIIVALAALLAAACASPGRPSAASTFDLGSATLAWQSRDIPVASIDVTAPSWLATNALQYRLLYADAMRRQAFAESRWAAPPDELVEQALGRQIANGVSGCRLALELDELIQVFDSPQRSSVQLEMRASLLPPRGEMMLARHAFAVVRPAASADAHGGVAATSVALQALADEMAAWLTAVAQQSPEIARRCSENRG